MSTRPLYKPSQLKQADPSQTRPKASKERPDPLLSYYQSSIPNQSRNYAGSSSTSQNEPATRSANHHTRKMSLTSMSSDSDYSYDSDEKDDVFHSDTNGSKSTAAEVSSPATRRSGTPSKGGADRRRMAIVQMDSVNELRGYKSSSETTSSSNSIRSRRGLKSNLTGLALVAPPDAALRTYSHLTPPSTAPVAADYMNHHILTARQDNKGQGHNRSASENPPKPSSRDTDRQKASTQGTQSAILPENNKRTKDENDNNGSHSLAAPMPRLPSPESPKSNDDRDHAHGLLSPPTSSYPSAQIIDMFSPIVTPNIGEGKEIHVPVAGPVVVKLDDVIEPRNQQPTPSWRNESPALSSAFSSSVLSNKSAYLHYEPGLHATAGPLPPPPRATININVSSPPPPRPPRLNSPAPARMRPDIQAVKQALQLPASVTAVLESKSIARVASKPTLVDKTEKEKELDAPKDNADSKSQPSQLSIHRREGATLSSSLDTSSVESSSPVQDERSETPSPPLSIEELVSKVSSPPSEGVDVPDVTVVEAPTCPKTPTEEKIDTAKFDQWLKENPGLAGLMSTGEMRRDSSERSISPMSPDVTGEAPSPPPKSLRNSISNNFKRFSSLPRTPSLSSRSESARRSSSRTPSPSLRHVVRPPFKKTFSSNPSALFCHEVHSQNTTLQRCAIYVSKINELYLHDCGLSEWVLETKSRSNSNGHHGPRGPSSQPFVPQPRQTSRSSMISEATFPIRPDASTATDLSHGAYRDITPPGLPPSLPYPSLAINPPRTAQPTRSNSSVTIGTPPSVRSLASAPSTKGAGFFASLGRKASLSSSSRKDRLPLSPGNNPPLASGRLPLKTPPTTANISRPIPITNPPSVPGGPRALPKRAQRSQTFTSSVSPSSDREDPLGRRPSLFNLGLDTVIDIHPDPAFTRQVDQLAALIPHADRAVLAGYLRRAGQDMLAIGQYLEDERMGTIRQP